MRQRARPAIDERTTTYDERLENHASGYAQDSRGPPVMAAPTPDCGLRTADCVSGKATPQSASLTAPLLGEPFCPPLLFSALFCSLLPHGLSLELT